MPVQARVASGKKFEELIREQYSLEKSDGRPLLNWNGVGNSNWEKLINSNFNPNSFYPNLNRSRFTKYDAKQNDEFVEIKKYNRKDFKKWQVYSEPIIKVAPSNSDFVKGNIIYDNISEEIYNDFMERFMQSDWWVNNNQLVLENIVNTSIGVYCKDGFIPKDKLEFKWVFNNGEYSFIFRNYKRVTIVFRLRQ